jgi:hypothetical protein
MRTMAVDDGVTTGFASGPSVFETIHASVARAHPAVLEGFQRFPGFFSNRLRPRFKGSDSMIKFIRNVRATD